MPSPASMPGSGTTAGQRSSATVHTNSRQQRPGRPLVLDRDRNRKAYVALYAMAGMADGHYLVESMPERFPGMKIGRSCVNLTKPDLVDDDTVRYLARSRGSSSRTDSIALTAQGDLSRRRYPKVGGRARRDSNSRPLGPQPNALSTELRAHCALTRRLAEREGFEPSMQVTPHGGLANRCTRPLCDLSVATAAGILSWSLRWADPGALPTRRSRRC